MIIAQYTGSTDEKELTTYALTIEMGLSQRMYIEGMFR